MLALTAATAAAPSAVDYNQLFEPHNATVFATASSCVQLPHDMTIADGSFIMPSLGQFEMGGKSFNGALDAFGKLSRFTIRDGKVCFATRMMETAFWNQSLAAGTVAPGLLFYETTPARPYSAMKNLNGPNDNSYVNTLRLGDAFYGITDSKFVVRFDADSLGIMGDVKYTDHLDRMTVALGSAHPLPEPNSTRGCVLDVRPQEVAMVKHEVLIYRLCPDAPNVRTEVARHHTRHQLPYFHSFGVSPRYAVLPLQHITFDMLAAMTKGTVGAAFKPFHMGEPTEIVLLPLDGVSKARSFHVPGDVFFVHAINAVETPSAVVFYSTAYDVDFFANTRLSDWRNETARDASRVRGMIKRFTLHTSGAREGQVDVAPLSVAGRSTDFPKINMAYHAKEYCLYWAVEWFHDDQHFSSMAIVRQDVCTNQRSYWYREGSFPSEPTFVPRAAAGGPAAEDDGVIMFTLLDGEARTTSLVMISAKTMQTVAEAHAPKEATIGYTTHGQWYEGFAPTPAL